MNRSILAALVCLLPACSMGAVGPAGSDGPPGPPGDQGPMGQVGGAGKDAAQDGSRLTARWINGADGSRQFHGDWHDTERDEVCAWQMHDGDMLCLPRILDANPFNTWTDAACTEPGFVAKYAPADYPEGSSVVHLPDGEILMRGEEVDTLWTDGSGLPCQPLASDGFPPPYFHWTPFDSSAFVAGTVE